MILIFSFITGKFRCIKLKTLSSSIVINAEIRKTKTNMKGGLKGSLHE